MLLSIVKISSVFLLSKLIDILRRRNQVQTGRDKLGKDAQLFAKGIQLLQTNLLGLLLCVGTTSSGTLLEDTENTIKLKKFTKILSIF